MRCAYCRKEIYKHEEKETVQGQWVHSGPKWSVSTCAHRARIMIRNMPTRAVLRGFKPV